MSDVQVTVTRRAALTGTAVAIVGAVVGWAVARNSAAASGSTTSGAANGYGYVPPASAAGNGRRLVAESSVPAGGGVVVNGARVVVTRDSGGTLHAFSAVCTHQGCLVSSVRGGTINCPCHGSRFDASTGAVVGGPAPAPLPKVSIDVVGGVIYAK
jgi:Rieske Fe-S protein